MSLLYYFQCVLILFLVGSNSWITSIHPDFEDHAIEDEIDLLLAISTFTIKPTSRSWWELHSFDVITLP